MLLSILEATSQRRRMCVGWCGGTYKHEKSPWFPSHECSLVQDSARARLDTCVLCGLLLSSGHGCKTEAQKVPRSNFFLFKKKTSELTPLPGHEQNSTKNCLKITKNAPLIIWAKIPATFRRRQNHRYDHTYPFSAS